MSRNDDANFTVASPFAFRFFFSDRDATIFSPLQRTRPESQSRFRRLRSRTKASSRSWPTADGSSRRTRRYLRSANATFPQDCRPPFSRFRKTLSKIVFVYIPEKCIFWTERHSIRRGIRKEMRDDRDERQTRSGLVVRCSDRLSRYSPGRSANADWSAQSYDLSAYLERNRVL